MLYTQIAKNKKMTYFIILGFIIITLAVGAFASYYYFNDFYAGMIAVTLVAVIYIPISISMASKSILRMNNAIKITEDNADYKQLFNIVDSLIIVARLPRPDIYIIEDASPNAFATGLTPEKSAVAVTTGLLNILSREELEGVIAHELAHIKNYDIRLSTIAIGLASIIIIIADFVGSIFIPKSSDGGGNRNPALAIIGLIFILISPLIAQMVQFCLSRNREYLADATAVQFNRNPNALASALLKIAQYSNGMSVSKSTQSLFIANPNVNYLNKPKQSKNGDSIAYASTLTNEELLEQLKKEKTGLFSTHPKMYDRISRLSKM